MNTKHTPGQLAAIELQQQGFIPSGDIQLVADIVNEKTAAPELLDALRTLVQMSGNTGQIEHHMNTVVLQVIAKATNTL